MGNTTPEGSHQGWCHSSGHHRNLLMPQWTEMGTGHHGAFMTQNFGRAPRWSVTDPKEPEGPGSGDEPGFGWEADDWLDDGDGEGSIETDRGPLEDEPDDEQENRKEG